MQLSTTYGVTSRTSVQVAVEHPTEDPVVDLADDLGVALQHERLDGRRQRHHRDAGEHERRARPQPAERRAHHVGHGDGRHREQERHQRNGRDRPVAHRRHPTRRSSASPRALRRRRRRAGTGRRAGCGRRPGRRRRRPRASPRRSRPGSPAACGCSRSTTTAPRTRRSRCSTPGRWSRMASGTRHAGGPAGPIIAPSSTAATTIAIDARNQASTAPTTATSWCRGVPCCSTIMSRLTRRGLRRRVGPRRRPARCSRRCAAPNARRCRRPSGSRCRSSTALRSPQPARAATVSGVSPQYFVQARKIRSGSASTMNSAFNCGYGLPSPTASAMFSSPAVGVHEADERVARDRPESVRDRARGSRSAAPGRSGRSSTTVAMSVCIWPTSSAASAT